MKHIIFAIVFVFILQGALAEKTIDAFFNFPLSSQTSDVLVHVTVPDDSNAFTAFMASAEHAGLQVQATHYSFGAFIECIEATCTSPDFQNYWLFSINNAPASIGVSDYIIQDGDRLSLDYFEGRPHDAVEWLFDNQQSNGAIGNNLFQHSFALMALSLSEDNNVFGKQNEINQAINHLRELQQNDAGFGDDLQSATAAMALMSNGLDVNEFSVNATTTLQTIALHQQNDGGFKSGSSLSDVDTTSWAMMAFVQAGQQLPDKNGTNPIDFLFSAQHENGSFGYTADDAAESTDFTEEAIIALKAANNPRTIQVTNALEWLSAQQNQNGCLQDGFRTALGAIAFLSWDENTHAQNALNCLESLQNGDGSFGRNTNQSNAMDTAIAIMALNGKTLPLGIIDSNVSGPGSDGVIGLNSTVKFAVQVRNTSNVSAQNVNVSLGGIPAEWVIAQASTTHFDEINAGETANAEIFVQLQATGEYSVNAVITTASAAQDFLSNTLGIRVKEAVLSATLFLYE